MSYDAGSKAGLFPLNDDTVTFNFEGKLLDGTVFDSSFARGQPVSGDVDSSSWALPRR